MDSSAAHRGATNHPCENNPLETLQSEARVTSQHRSPLAGNTIPHNWGDRCCSVSFGVGFISFTSQFLQDLHLLVGCAKRNVASRLIQVSLRGQRRLPPNGAAVIP